MQVQMVDIAAYHVIEGHTASLIVNPIVVELGLVNRTDDMTIVPLIMVRMASPFTLDLGRLLFTVTSFSVNVVSLKLVNFFPSVRLLPMSSLSSLQP